MSNVLRRYATYESLLVMAGADSARSSLFREPDGNEKVEDGEKNIFVIEFCLYLYIQKGNVYLYQPNVTFK